MFVRPTADVASDRCNLWAFVLKAQNDQKLPSKYYVSGASQYLAVLPIENHRAKQLDKDTSGIVDAFAQEKAPTRKFHSSADSFWI